MAVDEKLNKRFRKAVGSKTKLDEKRMMGGICFMMDGHMIGGADRNQDTQAGRFMVRVGKENEAKALATKGARVVEQGGRKLGGMIFVEADYLSDTSLKQLVGLARSFISTLPAK